ncbi:DUF1015 family protein [Bacillus sp. 165]|uniref:DUF1015 domain-containing protein n=1 Tax=Bacillus sp. 165 TaxID=1529117 RepID=UPI001ADC76B5|nr:DUF1015 family protein [Bacillus sp. 165]MBO9129203.1 DUF1015 domain-containing protein [Bacillus sp. 165]
MAIIKPFRAIRPVPHLAQQVAALPYDVMNSEEARELAKYNPYSFLHVDKAEIDLDSSISVYDERVYEKAKENLEQMIRDEVFIQEENPCLYIYQLSMNNSSQTGIACCTSIDDYLNNTIKKHEHTRPEKELDRIRHVDACNANTGPIFMTYRYNQRIQDIVANWIQNHSPLFQFTAEDGVTHALWTIDEATTIRNVTELFLQVDALYIADGHHRSASAVKVGLKRREQYPTYTGEEEFNFFLSVIFPANELHILDYNRIAKDLNGLSVDELLQEVAKEFFVTTAATSPFRPTEKHSFGMYIDGTWYHLRAKEGIFNPTDPVGRLDVSILQTRLLSPILGITDPRIDKRIDFIGGIRGLHALEAAVDSKEWAVAFSMHPTTMDDLLTIADAAEVMPPKSTWFEPKLRSGIIIHSLS